MTAWESLTRAQADTMCPHEDINQELPAQTGSSAGSSHTTLLDGQALFHDITLNHTARYHYSNYNVSTMSLPDTQRKLIVMLEPCEGVVYLFVRKTRRCYPNPFSCCVPKFNAQVLGVPVTEIAPPPCSPAYDVNCQWTHFHSTLDGTRDAAPTFYEVPLTSGQYFISVYAPFQANVDHGVTRPRYRLTVLADVGAYPRPGQNGRVTVRQTSDSSVELTWYEATFIPPGISNLRHYHVFSSLLLSKERRQNEAVFLDAAKVMNTVCGLEGNAVQYGTSLGSSVCLDGVCRAAVRGVVPGKRYMMNIVAESARGFNASYSGLIFTTSWEESRQAVPDTVIALVASILGTVFGVLVISYLWIMKLYD